MCQKKGGERRKEISNAAPDNIYIYIYMSHTTLQPCSLLPVPPTAAPLAIPLHDVKS